MKRSYPRKPWFTDGQHSGFFDYYGDPIELIFVTIKGASHQVPQSKRAEAFQFFDDVINEKGMMKNRDKQMKE